MAIAIVYDLVVRKMQNNKKELIPDSCLEIIFSKVNKGGICWRFANRFLTRKQGWKPC
jgi:hypothetical protein